MKERNHAFDFLCGICIIRMILYHITGFCYMAEEEGWTIVMHWTFFFMSFFFFKAGYFNKTVDGNSWEFTKKKFRQLMIPYFVWGFIGCLVYFTFAWFILDPRNVMVKSVTLSHIWSTSGFYGNGPCWFLFSFFVAYIAMHLFSKCPSIAFPITHNRSFRIKIHWLVFLFPFVSYLLYEQGNPLWLNLNNVFWGIFLSCVAAPAGALVIAEYAGSNDGTMPTILGSVALVGSLGAGIPLWIKGRRELDWMLDDYTRRFGPRSNVASLTVGPTSSGIGLALNF